MEFVPNVGPNLISRYDPHPTVFRSPSPSSYNPVGGAKFLPKLAPHTMGSPTMTMVSPEERRAKERTVWQKGGWALDSPPTPPPGAKPDVTPEGSPVLMRGGWPIAGSYSRDGGTWYTEEAPALSQKGTYLSYGWQQQKFLRATA